MRPLTLWTLLCLVLAAPLRAGQVEGRIPVEVNPGGQSGSIGAGLGAPTPINLTVPSLNGSLSAPTLAQTVLPSPGLVPSALVQPEILRQGAVPVKAAPSTPNEIKPSVPGALTSALKSAPAAEGKAQPGEVADGGRVLFDQGKSAAKADVSVSASPGWGARVRNWLGRGDSVPSWPGKAGDKVRLGGKTYVLAAKLADGGGSTVWSTGSGRDAVVKIIHPEFMSLEHYSGEASILKAIADSDIPHAKLLAASKDGSVLVKEFAEGRTASDLLKSGFDRQHKVGWPELAAKLIQAGVTADLAPGNLIWAHWRTKWTIVDGGGIADAGPGPVLKQLLTGEALAAGLDAGEFLSGLRARLGPSSDKWKASLAAIRADPALAKHLPALASYDAIAAKAPKLTFAAAPKGPAGLDDSVTTYKEAVKRLGYDPYRVKNPAKLHGEDPGKLNTTILLLRQPGKPQAIHKIAQWDIIRNEAVVRRFAKRWFGKYFRTPASVSVNNGFESWMVMEKAEASSSWKTPFNLEQRVAVALFAHTFGLSDVNQGNVLSPHDGGLPWIIDFEQALGRSQPVAGRLPDERIASEMPWMSRTELNRVEDYQPAIAAWREHLSKPGTQKAILDDLAAVGFTPGEAAYLLDRFLKNAADLDWSVQNDVDFVNQFVARNQR